ncbi:DUF2993 domain-containing protein [Spirillospora sp. NPDC029432]|uniref:LmeA family phospholipid-binding protein n=1 Tax=Spirillospora sp. NPDC029432 TaxID=3154599 RepID=UPI003455BDC6
MRKALLVLLILVIGGVVAADRIGVRIAQDQIGQQVQTQYNLLQQPDVKIHGFPFLTQAIGGEYDRIDVAIGNWTQDDVRVSDVRIELRGVQAPLSDIAAGNAEGVTVRTATASAVVPYSLIKARAPKEVKDIRPKGDNLEVDLNGTIMGFPVGGTAELAVKPTGKGLAITPVSVGSGGVRIPLNLLQRQLAWNVPVTELPVGSRISQVQPTPDGLRIGATADNVQLSKLSQS